MGADYVTLRDRIDELVAQHGTLRATARVLMTDAAYLHRLHADEKTEPGDPLLRRMGLREVRLYERAAGVDACATCGGARDGVPGNENLVDGKPMCDYCHSDLIRTHGVREDGKS